MYMLCNGCEQNLHELVLMLDGCIVVLGQHESIIIWRCRQFQGPHNTIAPERPNSTQLDGPQ